METIITPACCLVYALNWRRQPHWVQSVGQELATCESEAAAHNGTEVALAAGLSFHVATVADFVGAYGLAVLLELLDGLAFLHSRPYSFAPEQTCRNVAA